MTIGRRMAGSLSQVAIGPQRRRCERCCSGQIPRKHTELPRRPGRTAMPRWTSLEGQAGVAVAESRPKRLLPFAGTRRSPAEGQIICTRTRDIRGFASGLSR